MTTVPRTGPLLLSALAALATGCGGALGTPPCEDGSCGTQASTRRTFQAKVNRKIDILFVVDDTAAIAPHAEVVTEGLAGIGAALRAATPPLSLHAGFVRAGSCDASARGAACGIAAPEQFLRSEWCGTITNTNVPGDITAAFGCLGELGAADCGPAQPLASAVQSLSGPPRAGWEGFLRPDAFLMIVVVSATDDASGPPGSPTPVSDLVGAVKALKPDPGGIMVAMIGPGDCAPGETTGPRLVAFAEAFGANGLVMGLCGGDYAAAADRVTFSEGELRPLCLTNVRDTDTLSPGLQPNCTVIENSVHPDGSIATTPLPGCDASPPPCWRLNPPSPVGTCTGYLVTLEQGADWCVEAAENFTIECLGCADANDPACAPQAQ